MSTPRTLRARIALLSALAGTVVVLLLVAAFNLVLRAALNGDVRSRLRTTAAAAATTVTLRDGHVVLPSGARPAGEVWIYDGLRALYRPPVANRLQRAADALAGDGATFVRIEDHIAELHARPLRDDRGRQVGTVVAAESLDAWDHTTDLALIGSGGLGALLVAAILALTWAATGRALTPVREMTRVAASYGAGDDIDRRFGAGPWPDELAELAATFDALLDRVAASLRHEQRLSAELSHELRTPLARITAEVELLRRRERPPDERAEALAAIARNAEEMSRILETLMTAARADAGLSGGRTDVAAVLERLRAGWHESAALSVDVAGPLPAGADGEVVERILAPLLTNAARHAAGAVRVAARNDDGHVVVAVDDDGPGVAAADRERIFEPGVSAGDHGGAGLGLALSRRLARAAGGDVIAAEPPLGRPGARFVVRLPR